MYVYMQMCRRCVCVLWPQVQFATLSDYFTAVRKSQWVRFHDNHSYHSSSGFPVLLGDFFTYSDREQDYWSGYFTTRPFYKHLDRLLEARLR